MARHHPERDFIGVERLLGRVRKVCRKLTREGWPTRRSCGLRAAMWSSGCCREASVSRLHLLCPDPWPKVRHHRRRLVRQEFLTAVRRALEPGGEFLFMTDHEDYFLWAEEKVADFGGFERLPWEGGEFFHPKTDFQELWESEGKMMWRLRCRKPLNAGQARPECP